jgi:hypothetical protein
VVHARLGSSTLTRQGRLRTLVGAGVVLSICSLGLIVLGEARHHDPPPSSHPRAPGHPHFARSVEAHEFVKGNVHTHTDRSDGDSSPEAVVRWYRDHGYQFLALTDHELLDDPKELARFVRDDFTLVAGEEITMSGAGRQVHVNALCTRERITGGAFDSAKSALAHATTAIAEQGGVALVNHPNFDHGLGADDLLTATKASLVEVWSGHPYVYTLGTDDRPSHEALWTATLDAGLDLAPAGVDDAHHFGAVAGDRKPARPGRAWIQVFADRADPGLVCDKLREGSLYASSGAELARIEVRDATFRVWPDAPSARVEFVGFGGAVLSSTSGSALEPAVYTLKGDERYVRARVVTGKDARAFTPAFRVTKD